MMVRFCLGVLFALLVIGYSERSNAEKTNSQRISTLFESSFTHEAAGDLDRALNDVVQILRLYPSHYVANLRAGWLNYAKQRHGEAVGFYRKCIQLSPGAIEPRLGLLLPLMAQKQWFRAQTTALEILKDAPGNYTASSRLAFIYFSQGKYRKALHQYEEILRDYPSDTEMKLGLAWTCLKQGNRQKARRLFRQVLEIYPQNVSARSGLDAL